MWPDECLCSLPPLPCRLPHLTQRPSPSLQAGDAGCCSTVLAAPPAGAHPGCACTELGSPELGFPATLRWSCRLCTARCCLALSVRFLPLIATPGCRSSRLSCCQPHRAVRSHASPSNLFERVCKILLILFQIFPRDRIS